MSMYTWLMLAAIGALLLHKWRSAHRTPAQVATMRAAVAGGAPLVDVRTRAEFSSGHLGGAINVPLSDLGAGARKLGDTAGPVVVYCRSGARSRAAARQLQQAGFAQVLDLGPMGNWYKEP